MSFEISARYLAKPIEASTLDAKAYVFLENHSAALTESSGTDIDSKKWPHPRDFLIAYFKRFGFQIDRRMLMTIERDDEFEIWSSDFKLLGCSGGLMKLSSYTLPELMAHDWSQLFLRPNEMRDGIMSALSKLNRENRIVEDVTDWHVVSEAQSRGSRQVRVRVKSFSLATHPTGEVAFVALTKVKAHSPSSSRHIDN